MKGREPHASNKTKKDFITGDRQYLMAAPQLAHCRTSECQTAFSHRPL